MAHWCGGWQAWLFFLSLCSTDVVKCHLTIACAPSKRFVVFLFIYLYPVAQQAQHSLYWNLFLLWYAYVEKKKAESTFKLLKPCTDRSSSENANSSAMRKIFRFFFSFRLKKVVPHPFLHFPSIPQPYFIAQKEEKKEEGKNLWKKGDYFKIVPFRAKKVCKKKSPLKPNRPYD